MCACSSVSPAVHTTQPRIISSENNPVPIAITCIKKPRIDYFMYHYVRSPDPRDNASTRDLSIDPQDFRTHMSYMRDRANEWKIALINGADLISSLKSGCFPADHIWIFTSDDGWIDTYDQLVPIAREYRVPFFLGIITDKLDAKWFVTRSQVQEISRDPLFMISSHSVGHTEQDTMTREQEEATMCESRTTLESLIQKPIESYIYPVWKISKNSTAIAQKCGYQIAWSTGYGTKWDETSLSRYTANRIRIHNTTTLDLFRNILKDTK